MNEITVMGNLGGDAEERFTSDGQKMTSFSIASNRKGRDGQDVTTWFRITLFGDRFQRMVPFLKKGSSLIVFGELRVGEFVGRDGEKRTSLDVTADRIAFSPFGRSQQEGGQQQQQQQSYSQPVQQQQQQQSYAQPAQQQPVSQGFVQQPAAPQPAMSFAETGAAPAESGGGVTDDPLPF